MRNLVRNRIAISRAVVAVLALVALLPFSGGRGQASSQGKDSHFVGRGDAAELYWQTGDMVGTLYVTRGGSPPNPETWLYYHIVQGGTTVQLGYGNIPNGDLTGSAMGMLQLSTNTTVPSNSGFTRVVGAGGQIGIAVNRLGFGPIFQQTGHSQRQFFDSVLQISGHGALFPGRAQGNIMNMSPMHSWSVTATNLNAPIRVRRLP